MHVHITVLWWYTILANLIGAYNHSGYEFKWITRILKINSREHDIHHMKPWTNFGFGFANNFMDKLCVTYYYEE